MLKRMTKITGLLVCVASVISIVPAKADDVKKIEAQDGTVYSAIAKGNGIYIDGEINDKDEAQYWVSADGKYNSIEGLDAGDAAQDLLLNKYLEIDEDTMVDVTNNYKVIDNNTRADLLDDAATALRKKLKDDNDGRFDDSNFNAAGIISGGKFLAGGSGLAVYNYKLKTPFVIGATSIKDKDAVYSDYAGNYIDADYNLGSLKVNTTNDSVIIKNTKDTYEIKNSIDGNTYELKAVISDNKYATDISDSIYRFANLTIYQRVKGSNDPWAPAITSSNNWLKFGGQKYELTSSNGTLTVLQKFSKTAASDDVDGIKYSKDSTIYFIADEDGKSEVILGKSAQDSSDKLGLNYDSTNDKVKITGNDQGFCSIYLNATNKKIYAETLKLKSKNGFNYVDLGDSDNSDVADNYTAIQTAGGFAWVLDAGYIKEWDGDKSFKKVYKVDGAMNSISVSSKDNIIVWNEDDKVYSVIHNVAASGTPTPSPAPTTVAAGWLKADNGTWSYNKADGTKAIGWLKDGNAWYYLKTDSTMATGWVKDGSAWYYLDGSGAMKTGWINDNGTWYYLNGSGAMLANTTTPDGYFVGPSGAWVK